MDAKLDRGWWGDMNVYLDDTQDMQYENPIEWASIVM
jgi:hypothetical protein